MIIALVVLIILVIVLGLLLGYHYTNERQHFSNDVLIDLKTQVKERHLKEVLAFVSNRQKTANDDIERFLHVSDSTAERYLSELVEQKKIKRIGDKGPGIYYVKL